MKTVLKTALYGGGLFAIGVTSTLTALTLYDSVGASGGTQVDEHTPAVSVHSSNHTNSSLDALTRTKAEVAANSAASRRLLGQIIQSGGTPQEIEAATRAVVNSQINASASAYREYASILASDEPSGNAAASARAESLPAPTNTAQLPRYNTAVDHAALYAETTNSAWISEGSGPKVLYVFYDLRCPACSEVHSYLQQPIADGDIQVRYVPVGALGPESLLLATLAIAGENNDARLQRLARLMQPIDLNATPYRETPEAVLQQARLHALKNFGILVKTKRPATPTFAYMTSGGPRISVVSSKSDLMKLIGSIQPNS